MAIEMTPIFFKLMLVKSPYDFLKENVEELMKAEQGIHIEYNYHKDKEGQERDLVTHLHKEKLLVEKKSLQKVQEELTEYAIAKYREVMGVTDPKKAAPGTIRNKYGTSIGVNAIHGSDSPTSAKREISLFFDYNEIAGE